MTDDMLHRAWQEFARSPAARTRPGSGLGLSIVATIVARAHGQLRICFSGRHESVGPESVGPEPVGPESVDHASVSATAATARCTHGPEMTVTVLLPSPPPAAPAAGSDPA